MDIEKKLTEYTGYEDAINQVPFGNSKCQMLMEIKKHRGNARRVRHILLQINKKYQDLKKGSFNRRRIKVQIEDLEQKIVNHHQDSEICKIDIEEKQFDLKCSETLILDAMHEMDFLQAEYKKCKPVTREQFEAEERPYWQARLFNDARREFLEARIVRIGTREAMESIDCNLIIAKNKKGEDELILQDLTIKRAIEGNGNAIQEQKTGSVSKT